MGFFKKVTKFVSKGLGFTPITGFGLTRSLTGKGPSGPLSGLLDKSASTVGITTPGQSVENKKVSEAEASALAAARKAAHDAEVAQLSQGALGSVAFRRRRGIYASMFTGTPALAASSTGKTLLSQ